MISFIEKQFPVSKISKESYKERKAGSGQTLTGLGKWWGRKPLVLVRATILGSLMPASENPKRDMDIFLKIMSMDEKGLELRKEKSFTAIEMFEIANKHKKLKVYIDDWFDTTSGKVKIAKGINKKEIELIIFKSLGYDEKLTKCIRPEEVDKLGDQTWNEINHHLGTTASSIQELVEELSVKNFGSKAIVGDCFCGGGSIPFEAARIGCEAFASDLNPVAGLLTWSGLNLFGKSNNELEKIREFQNSIFDRVSNEIIELGIELNEKNEKAQYYLYCHEAECPECNRIVPLSPTWLIRKGTKTIAVLEEEGNKYRIRVKSNVSTEELKASSNGTITNKGLHCPNCGIITPIPALRKDRKNEAGATVYGLRKWEKIEYKFRPDDIYNERLYCICYHDSDGNAYFREPNEWDINNEKQVDRIIADLIVTWQKKGIIPSCEIESGIETERLFKERGWGYWHQLFNPRQLLTIGMVVENVIDVNDKDLCAVAMLLVNKLCNWNSKLCIIVSARESGGVTQTFANQALNTIFNYGVRSLINLKEIWNLSIESTDLAESTVFLSDARDIRKVSHLWITDPPYADAVNYHELSEFFLAWDKKLIESTFPEWYSDSKRILAVKGDEHFSQSMIDIYSNLTNNMHDDGLQVVMFTHSDPSVWAQLALIMWKSGLRVTAAWNIATETESGGLKDGNYVKGTVLLVLRKQIEDNTAYLDEINGDIKSEVKSQIESMQALEDKEEPNFSDPDYVLAAYAASLKVLTSYKKIGELDLDYELNLAINNPLDSQVVKIIENAKRIAYDCIIPTDFDNYLWKDLSPTERFYIKGLEAEKHNNYQISTYQEYARGFSIGSYNQLMANEKANSARLKTSTEFAMRTTSDNPDFEKSILRTILASIHVAIKEDGVPEKGLFYIKNQLPDYWGSRDMVKQLLLFIKDTKNIDNMSHWSESADMAEHLYILVDNDHI